MSTVTGILIIIAVVVLAGIAWTTINDLEKSEFYNSNSDEKHD
jgi:hypothetical protein